MELYELEVSGQAKRAVPWEPMQIVPLGDIQYGSEACDVERVKRHVAWCMEHLPNPWFLGMGDYADFGSPSNRRRLRGAIAEGSLYDTTVDILDHAAEEGRLELLDILAPTKGRWLGMLEGHHYWPYQDGSTTDTRLCRDLGAPFLGNCAFVNVRFNWPVEEKGHLSSPTLTIWCAHGPNSGGGRLKTANLNLLHHIVAAFDARIYLLGHYHTVNVVRTQRLYPRFAMRPDGRRHRIDHRTLYLAGTGSFLRGYMAGYQREGRAQGTYVEQKLLSPVDLGGVIIYATPELKHGQKDSSPVTAVDVKVSA